MAEKPLLYDKISTGMIFPEIEFEISEERLRKYTDAIDDFDTISFNTEQEQQNGYSRKTAPPTIGALFILKIYDTLGGQPDGSIHAKQQFKFLGPIYVGESIRTSGKVVGKHTKRDKQYVEVETRSLNSSDELILVGKSTFIWP